ncbi:hypothetical protein ACGLWX_13370 [Halomonas sp. HMF6819]|uniref:hypothetical protein n=1 Tax=Halomonas sp. HMF6819 TaxID=3373085 RepID=UPI0037A96FB2
MAPLKAPQRGDRRLDLGIGSSSRYAMSIALWLLAKRLICEKKTYRIKQAIASFGFIPYWGKTRIAKLDELIPISITPIPIN